MGPSSVIHVGLSDGVFYDHFCTNTDKVDFQVVTSQCNQNPKTSVVQIDVF